MLSSPPPQVELPPCVRSVDPLLRRTFSLLDPAETELVVDALIRIGLVTPAALACLRVQGAEEFATFVGHLLAGAGGPAAPENASLAGYALKKFYMLLAPQFPTLLDTETSAYWGATARRQGSEPLAVPQLAAVVSTADGRIAHGIRPVGDSRRKRARTGGLRVIEQGKKAHYVNLLVQEYFDAKAQYPAISMRVPEGRTELEWVTLMVSKGSWRSIRDAGQGWKRFRRWAAREGRSAVPPRIETLVDYLDSLFLAGTATIATPQSIRTSVQSVVVRFAFP